MKHIKTVLSLAISSALTAGLASHAYSAEELEAVVVTGSRVPTRPGSIAATISTVDQEAIEKAGVSTNVMEILRKSLPSFQGRSNAGSSNANNTNQNTAGGASVQLRNLDTLILVNGRRAAVSGIAAIGGKVFVDINQIPPSAVDHIEVLSDGASAIYGSDAVGGVVNIILKSGYKGAEVGFRYGKAKDGYNEESSYFTVGDSFSGFNLTVSGGQSRSSPLGQNKRSFSSPFFGTNATIPGTIGGNTILAPGLAAPNTTAPTLAALIANGTYNSATAGAIAGTYDLSQFQTLLLKQSTKAINATFDDRLIGKQLVFFGDISVSNNKTATQFLPIVTTVTVPAGAAFNPTAGAVAGVAFGYTPRPKQFKNDADSDRETLGLRGDLPWAGWGWEVAYVHSANKLQQKQLNVIYQPNLALAILGGFNAAGTAVAGGQFSRVFSDFSTSNPLVLQPALNPFARAAGVNPGSLENLYGTETIDTKSFLNSFDATLTGTILELPAGKPGFAFGLSHRNEGYSAVTDPNAKNTGPTAQRWLGGQFFDDYNKRRNIDAAFLEVKTPLTSDTWNLPGLHNFDLILAARQERYSDSGKSLVPKVGIRWQPVDHSLTLRASYGKSFTAPSLYRLNGPTATRQVGANVITAAFPGLNTSTFNGQDGNNPDLKPSKSETHSFSVTWAPDYIPGLTGSVEYSAVNQNGYPQGIGFNNVLLSANAFGSASPFAGNIARGNFPGLPGAIPFANPGDVLAYLSASPANANNVYIIDRFGNLGSYQVRAYTVNGQYIRDFQNAGTFTLGTTGTIFDSFRYRDIPTRSFYEFAGTTTNGGGAQGSLPKYRFYTQLSWDYQNWAVTVGNTFASSTVDQGVGGFTFATNPALQPIPVNHYVAWDLRGAWHGDTTWGKYGKDVTVAVGVNNVTNVMPPLAARAYNDNNADVSSYSPIGRLFYVSASAKFDIR